MTYPLLLRHTSPAWAPSRRHIVTAVGVEAGAGDEFGLVGCEEGNATPDFLGSAERPTGM